MMTLSPQDHEAPTSPALPRLGSLDTSQLPLLGLRRPR